MAYILGKIDDELRPEECKPRCDSINEVNEIVLYEVYDWIIFYHELAEVSYKEQREESIRLKGQPVFDIVYSDYSDAVDIPYLLNEPRMQEYLYQLAAARQQFTELWNGFNDRPGLFLTFYDPEVVIPYTLTAQEFWKFQHAESAIGYYPYHGVVAQDDIGGFYLVGSDVFLKEDETGVRAKLIAKTQPIIDDTDRNLRKEGIIINQQIPAYIMGVESQTEKVEAACEALKPIFNQCGFRLEPYICEYPQIQ
jgi:hypothetical protein